MEKQFDHKESLQLISQMINTARHNLRKGSGNIILVWGYLVMFTSLTVFILLNILKIPYQAHYAWFILIIGAIYTFVKGMKDKSETTRTYIDSIIGYVWLSFGITISLLVGNFLVIDFSIFHQWLLLIPLILLLYGLALFITGITTRFSPLIVGAIFCWAGATFCFYIPANYHMLVIAGAALIGFIIPGHLLNQKAENNV
jgi:hypothetical protein